MMENGIDVFLTLLEFKQAISYATSLQWYWNIASPQNQTFYGKDIRHQYVMTLEELWRKGTGASYY
jgi:hypothetical protein